MLILTDEEIDELLHEQKSTPADILPISKLTIRQQHGRRDFQVTSASGNEFVIAVRQSMINPLDFSAILGYKNPGFNTVFRLRRYNGKHVHTNSIERTTLNDFHLHTATERYQKIGAKEDSFAEVGIRHWDLDSAVRCLLEECGFDPPPPSSQYVIVFGKKNP